MEKLLIIGASGHGKVLADIATATNKYCEIAFVDDNVSITECMGFPVIGTTDDLGKYAADYQMIVAIGNAVSRKRITDKILRVHGRLATLVHPEAVVSEYASIGDGCAIMPGAVINAGAVVGNSCIVNTCASIDHDCQISDYVHLAVGAHLAGTVSVGEGTWIGIGAVVNNNISICDGCMIGAGAVVVNDITVPDTYIGVPAKKK